MSAEAAREFSLDDLRRQEEETERRRQPSPWVTHVSANQAETAPAEELSGEELRAAQDVVERLQRHGRDHSESR